MSFGFSIGDILAVSKLAHDIWSRIWDSSDQSKAIRTEFPGLYIVLDDAAQSLPGPKLDQKQTAHLASLVQACQGVLDDTNAVLEEFESLGVKSSSLKVMTQRARKKITWDGETIKILRGRIISNTMFLNAFIASFAKSVSSTSRVLRSKISSSLSSKMAQSTNDKVTVLDGRVQDLHSHNDDEERGKILKWTSPLNFSSRKSAILGQRQEGTEKWLLDSGEFQGWMSHNRATLLCVGMPGAGKTVLASIAIEHLVNTFRSQRDIGVAYIFCDYRTQNEQTLLNLLTSLLKQLLLHKSAVPEGIRSLYEQHNNGSKTAQPILDEVFESLQLIAASFSQQCIVVDALDEGQQHGKLLQSLLPKVFELQATKPFNLMLTSREIPRLTEEVHSHFTLKVRASDDDVRRHVDGRMDELPRFVSRDPKMQQTIKDAIASAVDGKYVLSRIWSHWFRL